MCFIHLFHYWILSLLCFALLRSARSFGETIDNVFCHQIHLTSSEFLAAWHLVDTDVAQRHCSLDGEHGSASPRRVPVSSLPLCLVIFFACLMIIIHSFLSFTGFSPLFTASLLHSFTANILPPVRCICASSEVKCWKPCLVMAWQSLYAFRAPLLTLNSLLRSFSLRFGFKWASDAARAV